MDIGPFGGSFGEFPSDWIGACGIIPLLPFHPPLLCTRGRVKEKGDPSSIYGRVQPRTVGRRGGGSNLEAGWDEEKVGFLSRVAKDVCLKM